MSEELYFNNKRLVIDLYGRADFYFLVDVQDGKPIISGKLKINDKILDLKDCDLYRQGPPHSFVHGISLNYIGTDISWKLLNQAKTAPETLILEEIEKNHEDIIVYEGNSREIIAHSRQPLPILVLKDRMGAFADLWITYGNNQKVPYHEVSNIIKRDRKAEQSWEKDLLETDFVCKPMSTSQYYCPIDKVAKSLLFLLELGWQVFDHKGNKVFHPGKVETSFQEKGHSILVKGKIAYGDFKADLSEVVGSFNRRERFVQLGGGTVGLLPQNLEKMGLNGVEQGEIVSEGISFKKCRIGAVEDLWKANPNASMDSSLTALKEKLQSFNGIAAIPPGKGFNGMLRPYQQEGVNWLSFLYHYGFNGILADDMGLGKTVQVLAFLSTLAQEGPILIVLPTSLLFNWQREIELFLPGMAVYRHHGADRMTSDLPMNGIILTSYATLRLDLPIFSKIIFQCILLDEAQAIKNAHTQTAQAVLSLQGKFRLSITGTPIENHLSELWSHFQFLAPELLGKEKEFLAETAAGVSDPRYIQRIKRLVRPFILRRIKEQVAKDLPERIEQTVWVEMSPAQRQIYDDFLAGIKGNLFKKIETDGIGKHRMEVLEAILRLRQICCHPLLVSSQLDETQELSSSKLDALLVDIETALEEGRKALVYSQFTSMLSVIGKELKSRGWNYAYLDGSTVDREKVVMKFQEDASVPLFLISLKAGGIGLNLTAADYVFLYDPWWNEAVENQAINRAHRIGRKDAVVAKRYIAVETIEEKMMKLKAAKRSLVDDILDENLAGASFTEDDLRFLLS